jgi:hypothetical protein
MNKLRNIVLIVGVLAGMVSAEALAGNFSIYAMGVDSMPSTVGYPTTTSRIGFGGGGAMFEFPLGSHVGLEIGANYLIRKFDQGAVLGITNAFAQVPIDLNFHFNRYLSLFVGGYGDIPINATYNTDTSTGNPSPIRNQLNFGANGGLEIKIPVSSMVGILVSGEYQYGFANMSTNPATQTWNFRDAVAKVGLTFGMMK